MDEVIRREGLFLQLGHMTQMQAWAQKCLPEEACGLLSGTGKIVTNVVPVENHDHSPVHFSMEPLAQLDAFLRMEKDNLELVGIFHSHPAGPPAPSATDLVEFFYPGVVSIMLTPREGGWQARRFWISEHRADEVPLTISETPDL
jgi:proteasome lid subunit RPN8/RPN11